MSIVNRQKIFRGAAVQRVTARLFFFLALSVAPTVMVAQQTNALLTNAADVISLPAEKAALSLKVSVKGVVTASDPEMNEGFFVQDESGGVFVDNARGPHLEPGTLVRVTGITFPGAYAPTITAPHVRVIGTAPLPPAKPVSIERLMSGAADSQRIAISGVVRAASNEDSQLTMDVVTGGYRYRAYLLVAPDFQPERLIGAQVDIRGTAAERHNRSLRQLVAVKIYIPSPADLVVKEPESINPFDRPVLPLAELAQFRRDNSLAQRVHVRGVVIFQDDEGHIFLEDGAFGLRVQSRQQMKLTRGEVADAIGFLSFEDYLPVLQDAVFRDTGEPLVEIKPQPSTIEKVQSGLCHADYISLSGRLIQLVVSDQQPVSPGITTTLVLQSSNYTFTAIADNLPRQAGLAKIPIGSLVKVSGICLTQIDNNGQLQSFRILIGNPKDVAILEKPGWLTPRRLLIGFVTVCSVLTLIVGWSVILSRKNSALNFQISEREKAQRALKQANDQLEGRVRERTEQLKFEITARKESEVRFKAVLTERTRLAQELHDTVEQTLTGIALQLDTASRLHDRNPENSVRHLELARSLMAKSQEEMRQSVWDLRSRAREQFDLASALAEGGRQITSGTYVQFNLETEGEMQTLPEVVEENLLRIGQEALANIIKHSQATSATMKLQFEHRQVSLQVKDNGIGFDRERVVGPTEGHFGLLGMSERARRLGGVFVIVSQPGEGTTLRVEIPLDSLPETQPPNGDATI